jgi:hypothetical protein
VLDRLFVDEVTEKPQANQKIVTRRRGTEGK